MILRYRSLKRWKYETVEVFQQQTPIMGLYIRVDYITLTRDGMLTIDGHYAWNGANVAPDLPCTQRASLAHDALYQLMGLGKLPMNFKPLADKLLRDLCIEDGMPPLAAQLGYLAVRAFGRPAKEYKEVIMEAG